MPEPHTPLRLNRPTARLAKPPLPHSRARHRPRCPAPPRHRLTAMPCKAPPRLTPPSQSCRPTPPRHRLTAAPDTASQPCSAKPCRHVSQSPRRPAKPRHLIHLRSAKPMQNPAPPLHFPLHTGKTGGVGGGASR